jgi:hypothetical protein
MKNATDKPTIYFDLDGTIYDLYGVVDWLPRLRASDPTPYCEGAALVDLVALHETLCDLIAEGYTVGVVSWLARGATAAYDKAVRATKRAWIRENLPTASEVHIVRYGTPKHRIVNNSNGILIDDETANLTNWTRGATIKADENLVETLRSLN